MTYLRAFIAGIALPALLLPILLCMAMTLGEPNFLSVHAVPWIPVIWGVWNVLYYAFFRKIVAWKSCTRMFVWGALLGLLLACYAIFFVHVTDLLGVAPSYQYYPLVIAPIVYGAFWKWIVKPLNRVVGLID